MRSLSLRTQTTQDASLKMGDCRIRIVIAKSLFASLSNDLTNYCDGSDSSTRSALNAKSVSFVRMYSADTTVREVVDENKLLKILYFGTGSTSQLSSDESKTTAAVASDFCLWDCTLNPPRDITSWPNQDFPDLQGAKSKTLHAAGLFPSGTWMAIPKGVAPNIFSDYDSNAYVDVQYNSSRRDKTQNTNSTKRVEFNDPSLNVSGSTNSIPLPSQVMETVSNRFSAEERDEELRRSSEASVVTRRRPNAQQRAQKELQRAAKLDQRIAMLEEQTNDKMSNKKKKVSEQVLRMLVKSRATGDKNLKERDRLYFQCLILVDDTDDTNTISANDTLSKEYRYFSPQDTFAKIANSFSNSRPKGNKEIFSEVLCRRSTNQTEDGSGASPLFGRFPVTMRVYEAQSEGYLTLSKNISNYFDDMLIIRWYKDREDATPPIQDLATLNTNLKDETDDTNIAETKDQMKLEDVATKTPASTPMEVDETIEKENNDSVTPTTFEDPELTDIIRGMDEANNNGPKKAISAKKSAAALKVRQMKMKSKAKGNKKLKMEDRVFLEVVFISETGKKPVCESHFLSENDQIERILRCVGTGTIGTANDWEFLVPEEDSRYRPIATTSILLKEAVEQEVLKSFERIILRPKSK